MGPPLATTERSSAADVAELVLVVQLHGLAEPADQQQLVRRESHRWAKQRRLVWNAVPQAGQTPSASTKHLCKHLTRCFSHMCAFKPFAVPKFKEHVSHAYWRTARSEALFVGTVSVMTRSQHYS